MNRTFILLCILIFACTNRPTENYNAQINKFLAAKNIDSLDIAAQKQLSIYDKEDSTAQYINLCAVINDSMIAWEQNSMAAKYAMLAGSKENLVQQDTTLKNKIATIAYNTEYLLVGDYSDISFIDSFTVIAETALRNTTLLPRKNNLANDLGVLYTILGDKKRASAYLDSCYNGRLYLQRTNTTKSLAVRNKSLCGAITNKILFFNSYGIFDSTLKYATEGLLLDSLPPERISYLSTNLAEALFFTGKKNEATNLINKSLALLYNEDTDDSTTQEYISSILTIKASLLAEQQDYIKSNQCLFESFTIKRENINDRYMGKTFTAISNNYLKLNNADSAIYYARLALSTVVKIDPSNIFSLPAVKDLYAENTIEESADALAAAYEKKYGEAKDIRFANAAINCYKISFTVENKLMNYYQYDDSKLLVLEESRGRSEKAINFCYQLLQQTKDNQWAHKAFEFAEGNKSMILLQSLKKNIAANGLLQTDSLYQKLQALNIQAAYAEKNIAEKLRNNDSSFIADQQKADKINNDILQTSSLLLKNNPAYKDVLLQTDSLNTGMLQQKILKDDSTALLEFFTGTNTLYAFVFSKNNPVQVMAYDSTMLVCINNYTLFFTNENVIASNPGAFQDSAFSLYQKLGLQNVAPVYKRLIIIPDGIFSFIPFESLLYQKATTASLKIAPYLITKCNISYGFSGSTLLKQTEQKNNDNNEMLAMAPLFINNSKGLAPLPRTAGELTDVKAQIKNGNYFLNSSADINAFRRYSKDAAYIHLATHAFANTGSTDPEIEFADSAISLNEIYAMQFHANLVVLSACNTGIGELKKGEGFMSLARGFYYAGAQNVINSLWQVNDAATGNIFAAFYKNIQNNTLSSSLQNAKLEYIQNSSNANASPYYWAGFVFIGNSDYQLPQQTNMSMWFAIAAIIIACAMVVIQYKKRKTPR